MICPHCDVSVPSGKWEIYDIVTHDNQIYQLRHFTCAECLQISIKFTIVPGRNVIGGPSLYYEEMLQPKTNRRKLIPKNVENKFSQEYKDAVEILPINAKASAALSRRVLQYYIQEKFNIKKHTLYLEIEELEKIKHYPPELIEFFHQIREFGNFAAHPKIDYVTGEIIEVELGEADSLLTILQQMFVYDYRTISEIKKVKEKLDDKIKRSKPSSEKKKPK